MKRVLWVAAALFGSVGPASVGQAWAQAPVSLKADDIIAARQATMDLQAGVVLAMKAAIDGGLDVKALVAGAKALTSSARVIPGLFPEGTQKGHDTKALPEIWSDRAGFEKAAATLGETAGKLVRLAEANDKAGFAAEYTPLTQACASCHRKYRAK